MTIIVSLVTKPRPDAELRGLVWSLTERPSSEGEPWYRKPGTLGMVLLGFTLLLNIIFF